MCVHGTVGTNIKRMTVCVRALYIRVPVNWNHKLLWVLEHAHNTTICTNTHKVQFHQDYSHMFRSFACYIFHNQLREATYFITLSNAEIPIHMELYLYIFMICDVLLLQDICRSPSPEGLLWLVRKSIVEPFSAFMPIASKENFAARRCCFGYFFSQIKSKLK